MGQRLELQDLLETILGTGNVYFQPPSGLTMRYPAIVYARDQLSTKFAENRPYSTTTRYQVTVIDRDPDSLIPAKLSELPMCLYSRHYVVDNLNHDVFNLYF